MSEPYPNNRNLPQNSFNYNQQNEHIQQYSHFTQQPSNTQISNNNNNNSNNFSSQQVQQKFYAPNGGQMTPQNQTQPQQVQVKSESQTNGTNIYLAILGLAESFQQTSQYCLCIHCLESILLLKQTDIPIQANLQIQIKTRLNLCRLYLKYTSNTNQILNVHLEKAMILIQNVNANDEYKYEATYLLYKIMLKQKSIHNKLKQNQNADQTQTTSIFNLDLLRNMIESSKTLPVWHLRLIFLISDILFKDRDYPSAAFYLNIGIVYCAQNRISTYTHIMFILTKGLVHLVQQNANELQSTMEPCAQMVENFQTTNPYQTEILKIFFLVLQVAYYTQCGQAKSVKNTLKSLQHYIQQLASRLNDEAQENSIIISQNPCENFLWLHKDHLGILTFLLAIVNYFQTGSFDKADKLIEKSLNNIQILKSKETSLSQTSPMTSVYNNSRFVTRKFNILILEYQIRSCLTTGTKTRALKGIHEAFRLCEKDQRLFNLYSSQLHCLLGMYSISVNIKESAINHFNISLKTTNEKDLWLYNAMSLALCYLDNTVNSNPANKNQLMSILDNVINDKFQTHNTALNAFASYFKALKYYLNSQFQPAQESLKEAIVLSNSEDLMNISANAYLFLGHINLITNQLQESYNFLINGLDLAEKMPDLNLKIYANSLLKYLFKYFNDPRELESNTKYIEADKQNSIELYQAAKMPQHILINWNNNTFPSQLLDSITIIPVESNQNSTPTTPVLNSPKINSLSLHSPRQLTPVLNSPKQAIPVLHSPKQITPVLHSPKQTTPVLHSPKQITPVLNSPKQTPTLSSPKPSIPKSTNNSPVMPQQSYQNQSPRVHHHSHRNSPNMQSPQQYRIPHHGHQQPHHPNMNHMPQTPSYHHQQYQQQQYSPVNQNHVQQYHSPQQASPRLHPHHQQQQQMHPQQYMNPQIQQQLYYQQQQQHQLHLQQQQQQQQQHQHPHQHNSNNQF